MRLHMVDNRPISQLPILSSDERKLILEDWNATSAQYPQKALHQLFEEQVMLVPDAVALINDNAPGNQLTFRELNQRANQLAHYLLSLGVSAEQPIGLHIESSIEQILSLLAILKSGCAYVPLDPTYPSSRLEQIIDDAQIEIVIISSINKLSGYQGDLVDLLEIGAKLMACPLSNPDLPVKPDHLLQILYTSGSTGKPKGVLNTHRGAVNCAHWFQQTYPLEDGEVCCQKTSLNFVDSVVEIFLPLLYGKPLVLISAETVRDPQQLIATLKKHRISRLILVPSLLHILLEVLDSEQLPDLKLWISSGEVLQIGTAQQFHKVLVGRTLLNVYGSTEVSADITWHEVQPGCDYRSIPIGRPISNNRIYVLDYQMRPAPIGATGMLYASGDGLARGYRTAELTSIDFRKNPFGDGNLYYSGDLVRWLPTGELEYIDRNDGQLSIRGHRIHPKEVEAAIRLIDNVDECVVVGHGTPPDEKLVAFVVGETAGLRTMLAKTLPTFMIPSRFISITQLTRLPNGKIDPILLNQGFQDNIGDSSKSVPINMLERKLCNIWEKALGVTCWHSR